MYIHRGEKLCVFHGESLPDMQHWLAQERKAWPYSSSTNNAATSNWDLRTGYNGAVLLAQVGWSEGAARLYEELSLNFPLSRERSAAWKHDVAGQLPDVPRFLSGMPDAMLHHGHAKGQQRTVHLVINVAASSACKAPNMANYGVAVVALIDALENDGQRVEVDVCAAARLGVNVGCVGWKVKRADEPVDLAAVAFSVGHPAAFRRLMFAMWERMPVAWASPGYGHTTPLTDSIAKHFDADGAFLLDGVGHAPHRCGSVKSAHEMLLEQYEAAQAKQLAAREE